MKTTFYLIFMMVNAISFTISAQSESKWDVGGYYSYLIESDFAISSGPPIRFQEHYLDLHLRYRFANRWRAGVEYIIANFTGSSSLENPYHLFGTHVDYNLVKSTKIHLNLRGGMSTGPLLFKGDELPMKRWVVNRIIGASLDVRLKPSIYLQFGYYNHYPLNSIKFKYGIAHPFIGAYVRL